MTAPDSFQIDMARIGLRGFMSTRCDVSSQHKLPTESEILGTFTAEFCGVEACRAVIREHLNDGTWHQYGPYLSDREIEVL